MQKYKVYYINDDGSVERIEIKEGYYVNVVNEACKEADVTRIKLEALS